jgi:nitrate reductase gamma subunit
MEGTMKEKTMFILSAGVMLAILVAIVGDYVVAAIETQTTGEAVEVSSDVMTLVQTALGGIIGILGGYFGAKAEAAVKELKDKE